MLTSALLRGAILIALPLNVLSLVLHEQLDNVPDGWSIASIPSSDSKIVLEVALAQSNITDMINALYSVSDPSSAKYGKYWSMEEVNELVAPSDQAKDATTAWLKSAGVEKIHEAGAYITFETTVGNANKLLNAKFIYYEKEGVSKLRTTEYSLHEDVKRHVDFIHPTTFFGRTVSQKRLPTPTKIERTASKRAVAPACSTSLTPDCIKELYNVPLNYRPDVSSGAYIGFGSFLNESAVQSDLNIYESHFGIPQQSFSIEIIDNGLNDQNASTAADGEANLDVQNIIGVSHPLPVVEFITGGLAPIIPDLSEPTLADDSNEPYLPYYKYLLSRTNGQLPQVISNSYGDDEQTVPPAYATHVCNLIGMMGLRGITILESSGDLGVGAGCTSNRGKKLPRFDPIFPATCPFLTSVGGTQTVPEQAWVGSSGGFSNYFARPYYQETAINTYLDDHVKATTAVYFSQFTNFSGRGFPDVAAMSVHPDYEIVYGGVISRSGGTSAAAPVWAGIVGLLNAARLKNGQPTLGFMNPWLYSGGYNYLRDITTGQSIGCNGNNTQTGQPQPGASLIKYATWNATKGWDPVTGWGVPNFEAMRANLLSK